MTRILYDLTASEDRRFSPFCWRTKLALRHKGLDYEARPVRFTEIDDLSDGPRLTLPTLEEDGRRIVDSWTIAEHLEAAAPDAPTLFPGGQDLARFVQAWTNTTVHPTLIRVILMDVFRALDLQDQAYFRPNREERFGMTLEAFTAEHAGALKAFRQCLQPLRAMLADRPFISGDAPAYADFIAAGAFLWAGAVGRSDVVEDGDAVAAWLARVTAGIDN